MLSTRSRSPLARTLTGLQEHWALGADRTSDKHGLSAISETCECPHSVHLAACAVSNRYATDSRTPGIAFFGQEGTPEGGCARSRFW
jgi:hypothetical protein